MDSNKSTAHETLLASRPCEVCGGVRTKPLRAPWRVVRCLECGFVFASGPGADIETTAAGLYEEEFAKGSRHPTYAFDGERYQPRGSERWAVMLQALNRYRKLNRVLDIGCSLGFLLQQAQEMGWRAYGLEVSTYAVEYARKHFGIDVHQGILEEETYPPGFFDAVICSHVLEHVPSPRALLRRIHKVLRPGGAVLILVPTQFSSLTYKLLRIVRGVGPPLHLQFFSRRTLSNLLRQEGFEVVQGEMNTQLTYLAGGLSKSKRLEARLEQQSEEMINAAPRTRRQRASKIGVEAIKKLVNFVGTRADFGDELVVYADRKPDRDSSRAAGKSVVKSTN